MIFSTYSTYADAVLNYYASSQRVNYYNYWRFIEKSYSKYVVNVIVNANKYQLWYKWAGKFPITFYGGSLHNIIPLPFIALSINHIR